MRISTLLLSCLMLVWTYALTAATAPSPTNTSTPTVQWHTNYEQALQQARATKKPLVLFFTGSDWCRYCKMLDKQALHTPEFAALAGPRFVFVKVDLPQDTSTLEPAVAIQNKALRNKYDIRSYPTLIILDPSERPIGKTEYKEYNGRQYAEHLIRLVQEVTNYQQRFASLQKQACPQAAELEKLYQQAKQWHFEEEAATLLSKAQTTTPSSYLLKEQYCKIARNGQIQTPEAQQLRQRILDLDTKNQQQCYLDLAMIDFEAYCGCCETVRREPEIAVAPLVDYLERFSAQDTDNTWRLQMFISQVFVDNDQFSQALNYAQNSYLAAPANARPSIAHTIQNLQAHLHH